MPELSKFAGSIPDLKALSLSLADKWENISATQVRCAIESLAARELNSTCSSPLPESWYKNISDNEEATQEWLDDQDQ